MSHQLKLYYYSGCIYCDKVFQYMDEHKIVIDSVDMMEDVSEMEVLTQIGGKAQAPCLVIDGKPLYESDDIIQWLGENIVNG